MTIQYNGIFASTNLQFRRTSHACYF